MFCIFSLKVFKFEKFNSLKSKIIKLLLLLLIGQVNLQNYYQHIFLNQNAHNFIDFLSYQIASIFSPSFSLSFLVLLCPQQYLN